ncbi:Protein of unknown function [Clostridium cavendishii DSM 21758]|uniref:DUF1097 domain-containing protein n=1 Tax=Clostridium cavendishii DSM 21758 TaxID=1121302 RepID=A0A1M6URH6_9CLOT|nr:DUF1097 domain-containing protein [Clostridium cavendishii]SHK71686.1 Protein of unknown function [Clostridium cavendishii DSM 21758]
MDLFTLIAISVGIYSGLWGFLSVKIGLITWVGFIGCTSYFASGGKRIGFKKSLFANITGVFWAVCIIFFSTKALPFNIGYIFTGIFSFVMCYQARFKALDFIPGAFLGACSTFGVNGDFKIVIPSLICGAIIGFASDYTGEFIYKTIKK